MLRDKSSWRIEAIVLQDMGLKLKVAAFEAARSQSRTLLEITSKIISRYEYPRKG